MKKKITILLVAATAMMLVGCGANEKKEMHKQNAPVENKIVPLPNHADPDQTSEQRNARIKKAKKIAKGDLRKNLKKAYKHITLCGKKLSYPLTKTSLEKDGFVIANEFKHKGGNSADLMWKDKKVGSISFEKKKATVLQLDGDALQGEKDFSFCGINMQSNLRELVESFGEGEQEGTSTWKYKNGTKLVRFNGFNTVKMTRSIQIVY